MKLPSILSRLLRPFSNSGYGDYGASRTRRALKNFLAKSLSAHSDIDQNNATLRSRARSLYMAGGIATAIIKSMRTAVIGQGLHLHAMVDGSFLGLNEEETSALNKEIEAEFEIWANSKDASITGLHNFYTGQQLIFSSSKTSGDIICPLYLDDPSLLQPYGLRFGMVEADRVNTPMSSSITPMLSYGVNSDNGNKIYDGVEVDERGRVIAYWIQNTFPGEYAMKANDWIRVEAKGDETLLPNLLHVMDSERPDQYRGVTFLAPVIEPILQLNRYMNSEIMAALVESYFTVFITSNASGSKPSFRSPLPSGSEESEKSEAELGPGLINYMEPGEDIKAVDPKRPNSAFGPFVEFITKMSAAAVEMPAEVLLKSFNSNYSASRAALQEFWKVVRMHRDWFITDFNIPIYTSWFTEAVARGRISAPGFFSDPRIRAAYLRHEWNGPVMPNLDPVREATAMEIQVRNGWVTNDQATTQLNGGDWSANVSVLEKEVDTLSPIRSKLTASSTPQPMDQSEEQKQESQEE